MYAETATNPPTSPPYQTKPAPVKSELERRREEVAASR